jgi:GrpB-like predicted nucleotidyltransferase (UPF0157 family)
MSKYTYKPYNPLFPHLFEQEKQRIAPHLPTATIEHIGSTAVPHLGGKGIIDIAIATPHLNPASQILQTLGYEFRPTFSTPTRLYLITFRPDPIETTRRYHIHLTHPSSQEWHDLIAFRDHLRTHPSAREEYAALKKQAAEMANGDGEQYRKLKEPIFQKFKLL